MKRFSKFSYPALFSLATVVLVGGSVSALAAGGIKAAYVEQVIPARTFSDSTRLSFLNTKDSIGPGSGIFGITSITLTNFSSSPQQVFIYVPVFSDIGARSRCGGDDGLISGGANPQMTVYVQSQSTLHLTYPTPLVISPRDGVTCIAAQVTTMLNNGSVEVNVNGVVN
jgi:hypothetical protein